MNSSYNTQVGRALIMNRAELKNQLPVYTDDQNTLIISQSLCILLKSVQQSTNISIF